MVWGYPKILLSHWRAFYQSEKVTWGGEYKKFATGYNVRDLWIGSEGTLGVITNAVLKLLPKPGINLDERGFLLGKASFTGSEIDAEEWVDPSILEYLDQESFAEEIAGIRPFKKLVASLYCSSS